MCSSSAYKTDHQISKIIGAPEATDKTTPEDKQALETGKVFKREASMKLLILSSVFIAMLFEGAPAKKVQCKINTKIENAKCKLALDLDDFKRSKAKCKGSAFAVTNLTLQSDRTCQEVTFILTMTYDGKRTTTFVNQAIAGEGAKGSKGAVGEKGAEGPRGPIGPRGYNGGKGDVGPRGMTGVKGAPGYGQPGAKGDRGWPGSVGSKGSTGNTGARGEKGTKGSSGYGQKGTKGSSGMSGSKGYRGSTGYTGAKGSMGSKGSQGSSGSAYSPGKPMLY